MEATAATDPHHDGTAAAVDGAASTTVIEPDLPDISKMKTVKTQKISSAPAAAHALTPPTSEELNGGSTMDDGSSDLSDLDFDGDEGEEIVPDHYYEGGKVPVFKPTMDQFRDFEKFVDKIDKYGMQSGIVKVIPPKEWRESLPDLSELVKTIRIKNPITQEFMGTHGTYTQANIEKQRSYNLPEWKALTEEPQHQPPARRGERRRNQEKVVRGGGNTRGRTAQAKADKPASVAAAAGGPRRRGRPRKNPLPTTHSQRDDTEELTTQVPPTPTSPSRKSIESVEEATPTKPKAKPKPRGRPPKNGGDQAKSVSSRRMNNTTEKNDVIDEAAFEGFDYRMDQEDLDEFTAERCAELETGYWKSVTFAQPMYAADMPGSLFEETTTSWNVAKLPNLLDVIGTKVPGVNTAYLYLGMWKATFAWHLEDVDLYSINYIHFGAPKQWYSISQEDARKFEAAMRKIWPNDSKNCDQFLRHKTYLISPELLQKQFGIKVNKLVHYEGEFVITYPYGYHSGYNLGYNCAESVNFATEGWLDYGRIARKCDCEADSVWVDVADIERRLRGEPTPEYYEETDDDDDDDMEQETGDLPSPPASVTAKPKAQPRKRKRGPNSKEQDAGKKKKRRIRIRIKGPTREPCILCPNDAPYEPLLPTDNGRMAHRACALFTPETWVSEENGVEKVLGVTGIDRARLELKCNYCRSKRGACFQCASKKCTRAFHATCALAAGVQIDSGMVPTFGEDGTEYFEEGFDFRCRFHRPKRAKNADVDTLESSKLVNSYAKTLKKGDTVQVQYLQGDVFAGVVVDNRPDELNVLIDVLPEGDRVEIEWKWLTVLDPMDSLRPKPSSSAIPMPEGMNKQSVSIENRQDGVPNMEELFHDNPVNKWAGFVNLDLPPSGYARGVIKNKEQTKIEMEQPDRLYYYLPGTSTEAKSRWTDDPKSTTPVAKADFMDRVKPAVAYRQPAVSYGKVYNTQPANPRQQPQQQQHPPQHRPSYQQQQSQSNIERPYVYKPKTPAATEAGWAVDQRALASQREFMHEANRHASHSMTPGSYSTLPPLNHHMSEPRKQQYGPLRPFPGEQYYSSRVLPAAVPGEYSTFSEQVRRKSGLSERRPSLGTQSHTRQLLASSSPAGPTLAHATSGDPRRKSSGHGQGQAPLLVQPFGGINSQSQTPVREEPPVTKTLPQLPLPATSAMPTDAFRRSNAEWTPPSRLFTSQSNPTLPSYLGGFSSGPSYPMPRQQPTYQSAEDFRSHVGQHSERSSAASHYSNHERMMRDANHGGERSSAQSQKHTSSTADSSRPNSEATQGPYQSTTTAGGASNGFRIPKHNESVDYHQDDQQGRQHPTAQTPGFGAKNADSFPSPKAPEYSPLSQSESPTQMSMSSRNGMVLPPLPQGSSHGNAGFPGPSHNFGREPMFQHQQQHHHSTQEQRRQQLDSAPGHAMGETLMGSEHQYKPQDHQRPYSNQQSVNHVGSQQAQQNAQQQNVQQQQQRHSIYRQDQQPMQYNGRHQYPPGQPEQGQHQQRQYEESRARQYQPPQQHNNESMIDPRLQ